MRKMRLLAVGALLGMMLASCAFRSSSRSFGPYSDAENFYKKGDYTKAIGKYQEYLSGHPQGNMAAIAAYYIAKSYAASGDMVKAREHFKRVIKQYPQTSWAEFSQEQLDMLQGTANS